MADETTEQKHTTSIKDLTKANKKQKGTLGDQQAEIEAQIDISKARRATIEGLIDVSGDLKVAEKDQLTTRGALKDQVTGAGMSIVQGAEGFVTEIFGGPIGGLINTLSMGFLTRWLTNRKQEGESQKARLKKEKEEDRLTKKRIDAMAEVALKEELILDTKDKEYDAQQERLQKIRNDIKTEFERREEKKEEDTKLIKEKKTQAFLEGKSTEEIATIGVENQEEAKENGGEIVEGAAGGEGGEGGAGGDGGIVAAGEGMSLDTTNEILTDIEEHLSFMVGNQESAEDRRERLRNKGAKKAGGKIDVKKEDDEGFSFMGLMGTIIGAISGALLGASAGLVLGFLNMWKNIFKFIGGKLAKIFPNVTKMLSDIFGKGGKISKFFTAIKTFFLENKAFKVISDLIDTVKGAITKALKPVKTAFTSLKTGFTSFFTKIKSWLKLITGPIDTIKGLFGGAKEGGKLTKFFGGFKTAFKSFFKIFKTFFAKLFFPLQVIISLVEGFFEAKDAVDKSEGFLASFFNSIVGFFGGILDGLIFGMLDLIKDGISWIAGFLGFEDVEKFLDSFSFSDMFNEFLDSIYAWFNLLFSDPVQALSNLFSTYFGAVLSVGDFILDMIKAPFVWIMELFGWDDAAAATESFSLSGLVMGIFDTAKEWLGSMFQFDSASGLLKSVMNIMMWVPNLFVKAVAGIASWFAGLLGFKEESKAIADAGKEFSFGDLIFKAVEAIGKWFGDLFDSIMNFDFKSLAKSIMPDFLANMIFGDEPKTEKTAETKKVEQKVAGGEAEKVDSSMFSLDLGALMKPIADKVSSILDPESAPFGMGKFTGWIRDKILALFTLGEGGGEVPAGTEGLARGGIVTKPAYLPASGTVVGEHSSWSGKGAAEGGVPKPIDGGSEAIIPLEGQKGGAILAAALAPAIAGAILNELMMARAGGAGAEGGSATVIQDNSTNQVTNNNTTVTPPQTRGQILPGQGRDHGVSHFTHAA